MPSVLGFHRYAPVYAALPFTEAVGDDRFVTAAFCFGYGPLPSATSVSARRRGAVQGRADGVSCARAAPMTRCSLSTRRRSSSAAVDRVEKLGPTVVRSRASPRPTSRAHPSTSRSRRPRWFKKDGGTVNVTVAHQVRYRLAGTDTWATTSFSVTNRNSGKPLTRTFPIAFPERGPLRDRGHPHLGRPAGRPVEGLDAAHLPLGLVGPALVPARVHHQLRPAARAGRGAHPRFRTAERHARTSSTPTCSASARIGMRPRRPGSPARRRTRPRSSGTC